MSVKHKEAFSILFTGVNSGVKSGATEHLSLAEIADNAGFEICQDLAERPDLVICVDYKPRYRNLLRKAKRLGIPRVLVKHEPPTVIPEHGEISAGDLFDAVITRGVTSNTPVFNIGALWDTRFTDRNQRYQRIVAITADKWSFHPRELYSLRRQVYSADSRLDLFGHGWEQSRHERVIRLAKEMLVVIRSRTFPKLKNLRFAFLAPQNYLGPTRDKHEVLSRYQVSLVIENDISAMSEKLLDCILSGTIPVYVGPKVSDFGIPSDLVVESSPNLESVLESINIALALDHVAYRKRALTWVKLKSSEDSWDPRKIGESLINHAVGKLKYRSRHSDLG